MPFKTLNFKISTFMNDVIPEILQVGIEDIGRSFARLFVESNKPCYVLYMVALDSTVSPTLKEIQDQLYKGSELENSQVSVTNSRILIQRNLANENVTERILTTTNSTNSTTTTNSTNSTINEDVDPIEEKIKECGDVDTVTSAFSCQSLRNAIPYIESSKAQFGEGVIYASDTITKFRSSLLIEGLLPESKYKIYAYAQDESLSASKMFDYSFNTRDRDNAADVSIRLDQSYISLYDKSHIMEAIALTLSLDPKYIQMKKYTFS